MVGITAKGVAFRAMSVDINMKTKQQLESEDGVEQQSGISKPNSASSVKDGLAIGSNEQAVLFADPTNGALVKLNLSNENIDKLKKHFTDENNFFERKDGSLRLNGEAEAFVTGWFGDIAYKREFLTADADKDGKLNEKEYQETKNGFNGAGTDYLLISKKNVTLVASEETVEEKDIYSKVADESTKAGTVRYNDGYMADSIESELNTTIRVDKDFSSTMELSEAYRASSKNMNLSTEAIITKHINDYYHINVSKATDTKSAPANIFSSLTELTDRIFKRLNTNATSNEEIQKALQKLRASNGNENALTAEEKEALGAELASIKKQFEKEEDLSSIKQELKDKIESTQFIDVRA